MPSFIKSQFSYYPLIWIFCSRTSMNKLNNIHEKYPRLVTNDYNSNFDELLEPYHELSIHKTCINYLMIEVYKYLHVRSPKWNPEIFTLLKNPCNIRNIYLFGSENLRSVSFGVHAIALRASQLWQILPMAIKDFSSKIKSWSFDNCPCNLCKRFM